MDYADLKAKLEVAKVFSGDSQFARDEIKRRFLKLAVGLSETAEKDFEKMYPKKEPFKHTFERGNIKPYVNTQPILFGIIIAVIGFLLGML